jgi:hypothetical protein
VGIKIYLVGFIAVLSACASRPSSKEPLLVDDKYSLKADREELDKLRKEIPEDVKRENDEKAFLENLLGDPSQSPSDVRNRFSNNLNKRRDQFNKDMASVRQDFTKNQQRERDVFVREQEQMRKDFSRKKVSSEERKDFFDGLDQKRKDFFSRQRDGREQFEADSRDKRKNFDDYIKSKQEVFNQQHRDFLKRNEEYRKSYSKQSQPKAASRKELQEKILDEEYRDIKQKQPVMIESGESQEN